MQRSLKIRRGHSGSDHGDLISDLESLGVVLAHEGRYAEAEKLFREATQGADKATEGSAWYNFACAAAIAGRRGDALDYLSKALEKGCADMKNMDADEDLKSLRGDPRFATLLAKARQGSAGKLH